MTSLDVMAEAARPRVVRDSRGVFGWVCTSNPFYVLSALLVCLGLWVSFGSQVDASQTWSLLLGMAGYTLLLAVTACLLVRYVGVWDDVRTVMLLVVLMFLATSVTFDEVLARDPMRGVACYVGGLLFAAAVSEGMLRGVRLRLPPLFRAPYYFVLTLFFVYPVALTPLVDRPRSEELSWALFGFSPAAALIFLTLLPAIRRGRGYVHDNGSPWRWAWYPWTLFGVLAFAVPARSALLCWSMHHVPSAGGEPYIFGPYFLVPIGLAIAVVLLEIGLVEKQRGVAAGALLVPLIMVSLTLVGHRAEPTYQWFLERFVSRLGGTPFYLTLLLSAGFFAYAALRRAPMALDALMVAMVAIAFVSPGTLDLAELIPPRMLPILVVGVSQTAIGLWRRSIGRSVLGSAFLVAAAMIAVRGSSAQSHPGPLVFHFALVAALGIGAVFDDRIGLVLRTLGASMAVVGSLFVLTGRIEHPLGIASWAIEVYPPVVCLIIAGYGLVLGHRTSLALAGLIAFSCLASAGWRGYCSLRQFAAGVDYIVIGMLLFSLAVLTSMAKGGLLSWGATDHKPEVPRAPE
jgi:hypothetical protein